MSGRPPRSGARHNYGENEKNSGQSSSSSGEGSRSHVPPPILSPAPFPDKNEFPIRPAYGSGGNSLDVFANYFPITANAELSHTDVLLYSYPVKFDSEDISRSRKHRLMELLLEKLLPDESQRAGVITDFASFFVLKSNDMVARMHKITFRKKGYTNARPGAAQYELAVGPPTEIQVGKFLSSFSAAGDSGQAHEKWGSAIQALNCAILKDAYLKSEQANPSIILFKNKVFQLPAPANIQGNNPDLGLDGGRGGGGNRGRGNSQGRGGWNQNASRGFGQGASTATEKNCISLPDANQDLLALRGVFKSVRPAEKGILLNVNPTYCIVHPADTLDKIMLKMKDKNMNMENMRDQVKMLKITRKNRAGDEILKTIWGFSTAKDGHGSVHPAKFVNPENRFGAGSKDVKFYLGDEKSNPEEKESQEKERENKEKDEDNYITVHDYFLQKYNFHTNPSLPVLNVGSQKKPVYFPAEVCMVVPGQRIRRQPDGKAIAQMIKFAVRDPMVNKRWIESSGRDLLGLGGNSSLDAVGITIGSSLIEVKARKLPTPQVQYKTGKLVPVSGGTWNLPYSIFCQPCRPLFCSFFWFRDSSKDGTLSDLREGKKSIDEEQFQKQIQQLEKVLSAKGIMLVNKGHLDQYLFTTSLTYDKATNDELVKNTLESLNRASKPNLIFVFLPSRNTHLYRIIKTICDTRIGVHSVCMTEAKLWDNVQHPNRSSGYFGNVALKVNAKMGGTNHTVYPKTKQKLGIIDEGKTMVVGLDVTHPQPGSKSDSPSVAGIVASVDVNLIQWPGHLRVQQRRLEIVSDLKNMFVSRLQLWKKNNRGHLPENIIVFRDGVSEGQYKIVLDQELKAIRAAFEIYGKAPKPALSIIIVGKRHHTRFYPKLKDGQKGPSNCEAGTVIDSGVTETQNWDFYLQAHHALKGTARPIHYYVVYDEIFRKRYGTAAANELEMLTYNMCHLFARATKSVSVCPPAYYADILCERARCYLSGLYDPLDQISSTFSEDDTSQSISSQPSNSDLKKQMEIVRKANETIAVCDALKDEMFYI